MLDFKNIVRKNITRLFCANKQKIKNPIKANPINPLKCD